MILGFDIGNTNTLMGVYDNGHILPAKTFRFRTERDITPDELGLQSRNFIVNHIKNDNINAVIFSSVVGEANRTYHIMSKEYFGVDALEITCNSRLSIKLNYDDPARLGVDRIVNAEAVFREYKRDCIIIDLGTAATFCVLHSDGNFDGGIIAPGIGVTIDALADKTSKLVKVTFEKPENMIARNTVDAIKSGFFYGWISLVDGIIQKIKDHYGIDFSVIITGGFCNIIGENISHKNTIDSMLTMKGIKYIYDLNR